jgi:hypothetical protein
MMRFFYITMLCLIAIAGIACQQDNGLLDQGTAISPEVATSSPNRDISKQPEGAPPGAMWVVDPCDDHDCGDPDADIETEEDLRFSLPPRKN